MRPNGGHSDEPVHDVQEPGDRPAGLPPRCARSNQHSSGAADRRAAAGLLAGVAPGRRRRNGLTTSGPRIRHHPRRARGDRARRGSGLSCPAFVSTPDKLGAIASAIAVTASRRRPEHCPAPINCFVDALHGTHTLQRARRTAALKGDCLTVLGVRRPAWIIPGGPLEWSIHVRLAHGPKLVGAAGAFRPTRRASEGTSNSPPRWVSTELTNPSP